MKVLVTSPSSPIGSSLCRLLLSRGFTVRVLVDAGSSGPIQESPGLEPFVGDLLDAESTQNALAGAQAVFDCSLSLAIPRGLSDRASAANLEGTRNLLVAMTRAGVEDLVHVGSALSFEPGNPGEPGDEERLRSGIFEIPSFDSALRVQEAVLRYASEGRLRAIVVNPTFVLPSGPDLGPGWALAEYARRSFRSYPGGHLNVVGASHAAAGALKALGRGRSGRCYILAGENTDYRRLFELLAGALGADAPEKAAGEGSLVLKACISSLSSMLTGRPCFTPRVARLSTRDLCWSPARAVSELDFEPPSLEAVVEEASAR